MDMFDDDFFEFDDDLLNATGFFGIRENTGELSGWDWIQIRKFESIWKSNLGDDPTAADLPTQVRYLDCIGEDVANQYCFAPASFIGCAELKLVQNSGKHFTQRPLFDLDLSEDVLTDSKMLQKLLNKARWVTASLSFVDLM